MVTAYHRGMSRPAERLAIESIRARFLARCLDDADEMLSALRRGDLPAVEALAHRMVGAAGALEEDAIAALARRLLTEARAMNAAAVSALLTQLRLVVDARRAALPPKPSP